ncbi:ATP-binding protein [Kitasatospora cineracea]
MNYIVSADQQDWTAAYEVEPESVRHARRGVRDQLCEWGWEPDSPVVDDLATIASELVTNVVQHAAVPGKNVVVRLHRAKGCCRIEVLDGRPDLLPPTVLRPSEESGRGLLLVRSLSAAMGVERSGGDKIVWAEVPYREQLGAAA